jgi:hypothetical protein
LHNTYEKEIEKRIDDKIHSFLASIPDIIEEYVSCRNLQSSWNPDAVHRDVDASDYGGNSDFEVKGGFLIDEED